MKLQRLLLTSILLFSPLGQLKADVCAEQPIITQEQAFCASLQVDCHPHKLIHHEHPARPPVNLSIAKDQVNYYYDSGAFQKESERVINCAIAHFKKHKAGPHDVVVFDVDDTVLSNYQDMKKIEFGYVPKLFHEWVLRADAPALESSRRLYNYLLDHGYHIIFVTGRQHDEYDATVKNLKLRGFTGYDKLIVRPKNAREVSAREYKIQHRTKLAQEGWNIVGVIGDQASDLCGPYSGYRIKLPNYIYHID